VIGMCFSADPVRDPSTLAIIGGARAAIPTSPSQYAAVRVGMIDGKVRSQSSYEESKAAKVTSSWRDGRGTSWWNPARSRRPKPSARRHRNSATRAARNHGGYPRVMKKCVRPKPSTETPAITSLVRPDLEGLSRRTFGRDEHPETREDRQLRRVDQAKVKALEPFAEELKKEAGDLFDRLKERIFRDEMLKDRRRPDGRKFDQVRQIDVE